MPEVNAAVILLAAAVLTAAAAAVFLAVWLTALRRGLRRGAREVEERLSGRTSARLDLPCPDKSAEELFGAVNEVLELRAAEQVAYREKERTPALLREVTDLIMDGVLEQLAEIRGERPPSRPALWTQTNFR